MHRRRRSTKAKAPQTNTQNTGEVEQPQSEDIQMGSGREQGNGDALAGGDNSQTQRNSEKNTAGIPAAAGSAAAIESSDGQQEVRDNTTGNYANASVNGDIEVELEGEGDNGEADLDIDAESDAIWTPAREDKLIDLYRDCPFLYDKNSAGFVQRHKKDLAYAKFATILGVTGTVPLFVLFEGKHWREPVLRKISL